MRTRLLENEIRVLRDESNRLALDLQGEKEKVKENMEKIKLNKQLPYLVGNVVEILDLKPEVSEELDSRKRGGTWRDARVVVCSGGGVGALAGGVVPRQFRRWIPAVVRCLFQHDRGPVDRISARGPLRSGTRHSGVSDCKALRNRVV